MFEPIKKTIYIDIDGTLYIDGGLNRDLVKWLKIQKRGGADLILWSARGRKYAKTFVEAFDMGGVFDAILGKPVVIADDRGWQWTQYVKTITRDQVLIDLQDETRTFKHTAGKGFVRSGATDT